jgi:hypothetical protein
VSPFKEIHGQLEDLGFPGGKEKLFAALRAGASRIQLFFLRFPSHFPFDNHPGSALGTRYARTHDPVRHLTFSVNDLVLRKNSEGSVSVGVFFFLAQLPLNMPQNAQPRFDILGRKLETAHHATNSLLGFGCPLRQHVTAGAEDVGQ